MTVEQLSGADVVAHVGARLRAHREALGWSLPKVQAESGGHWKAVVVGSYERADRSATLARLWDLAAWYGIPFTSLLPPLDDAAREAAAMRAVLVDAAAILRGEVAARLNCPEGDPA